MRLSHLERQLLRYQGLTERDAARACGCTVEQVRAAWSTLNERATHASPPRQGPARERMSFDAIDRMMRGNRAPVTPANPEIGWTPETEGSW